jgi:hypothetical protein
MSVNAPSIEDIKAGFVHQTLDPIIGQPNYATLDRLSTQTIRNGATVSSRLGGGNSGLAGLSEAPDLYLLRTGVFFNRPLPSAAQPIFPAGAAEDVRAQITSTWKAATVEWLTVQRTETIQLSMLERALESTYLTGIHDEAHGFGTRNLQDVLRFLFTTYGQIGPDELLRNQTTLCQPVDPNAPLAIIFKQIEDCQKYATAGGVPLTPQQIMQAAQALVLQTGKYTQAYREWMAVPQPNQTYLEFKRRFNNEYQLQNSINATSQSTGYQANNAYGEPIDTDLDETSLASAAQDFAAAKAARQGAMAQLTNTNGNLNSQLANMAIQNQQLQQQMNQMQQHFANLATIPHQAPPGNHNRRGRTRGQGRGRSGRSNYQQPPATHGYMPIPPNGQPAPTWQPAPGLPAQQAPAWQQPPTWQPPRQANWPPAPPAQPWSQPAARPAHPNAKIYNNQNYCWSHGADIGTTHTGWTCRNMTQGHQPQATRQNPMGGNPKDMHKVWMGPAT